VLPINGAPIGAFSDGIQDRSYSWLNIPIEISTDYLWATKKASLQRPSFVFFDEPL